jgi:hypothetical protein
MVGGSWTMKSMPTLSQGQASYVRTKFAGSATTILLRWQSGHAFIERFNVVFRMVGHQKCWSSRVIL